MPSNFLLLVPLLAGHLFNHLSHRRRFEAQTKTGHRLIFEAAAAGLIFFGLARGLVIVVRWLGEPEWLARLWPLITSSVHFAGTMLLSVILSVGTAISLNLFLGWQHRGRIEAEKLRQTGHGYPLVGHLRRWWLASKDYSLDGALSRSGNALQRLLHDVVLRGSIDGRCVGLSLSNGKVYAGWVTASPNLSSEDEYVSLLPLMSGHRDKTTLKVIYDFVYPLGKFKKLADDSEVVVAIPISQILSAHLLDRDYWRREVGRIIKGG